MNEVTVPSEDGFDAGLIFIGVIGTPWKTVQECPITGLESTVECTIDVDETYQDALLGIEEFPQLLVLYWMNLARRNLIVRKSIHYGDVRGVFAFRCADRPNPIAMARAKVIKIAGSRLTVTGLDCIDGTRLIDIKPFTLDQVSPRSRP